MDDNSIIDDLLAVTRPAQYTVLASDDWSGLECAPLIEAAVSLGQEVVTVEYSQAGGNYVVIHKQSGYLYRLTMDDFGNPFRLINGSVHIAVPMCDRSLSVAFDAVPAGDVREIVERLVQDLQVLRHAADALKTSDENLDVVGGHGSKVTVMDYTVEVSIDYLDGKRQAPAAIAEVKVLHRLDGSLELAVNPPDWGRGWDVPNTGKVLNALVTESGGVFTRDSSGGSTVLGVHLPASEGV